MTAHESGPLKRTPLYDVHVKAGAKMVPFGGWEMPVQYTGIVEEHRAVRSAVGLFDISHMGEFEAEGPGALAAIQRLCTNDAAALTRGQVQYSLLCYPEGGIVDDLTLYRFDDHRYMLTVNASNIDKDWHWVTSNGPGATWRNMSVDTALLAVQGPKAEGLVQRLADTDVVGVRYYHFIRGKVGGRARGDLPHRLHRRGRLRAVRPGGRGGAALVRAAGGGAARTASSPSASAPATPCAWR